MQVNGLGCSGISVTNNYRIIVVVLFCQSFEKFGLNWKLKKLTLVSRTCIWKLAKPRFVSSVSSMPPILRAGMKTAIRDHELNIKRVEVGLNRNPDVSTRPLLQEERMKLSSILHEKVQGALLRSCVFQLKDMDAPSSFFLQP